MVLQESQYSIVGSFVNQYLGVDLTVGLGLLVICFVGVDVEFRVLGLQESGTQGLFVFLSFEVFQAVNLFFNHRF